ncbi:hypothetical protein GYMLUDRAFT_729609 [Collybiopsis luxurians FD-317 M1]|nr:hypothetical protein GYMLUDRAFT_729609 [Collybiopsis luxurians FD-317 M1]
MFLPRTTETAVSYFRCEGLHSSITLPRTPGLCLSDIYTTFRWPELPIACNTYHSILLLLGVQFVLQLGNLFLKFGLFRGLSSNLRGTRFLLLLKSLLPLFQRVQSATTCLFLAGQLFQLLSLFDSTKIGLCFTTDSTEQLNAKG